MKRVLAAFVLVLACVSIVQAQGSIDAENLYLGTSGGTICRLSSGSGAPSAGSTCDTYLDYSTGDLYTKHSGTWTVIPRLEAANVFTAAQSIQTTEPALYFNETDQGVNLKNIRLDLQGGTLQIQTLSDVFAVLATTLTFTRTGNLAISGSLTAGSGAVGIIDSTGKIPAISSTYFASLSGANLTAVPASVLTGTTLPAAIVTSSLTTVGALNAGNITSGFGAINIGTDALTSGSLSLSGSGQLLTLTNSTAGATEIVRAGFANDLGTRFFFTGLSSTFTTSGPNVADGLAILSSGAGGVTLGAINASGDVRVYARNALAATWGASQALTLTGAMNVTGVTTHTGDVLPATAYTVNLGALTNKLLTVHAAELWVETLVAQNTMATIGGRVLVAPTNILSAALAAAGTTITVKYNNFANGDRIYLEANGQLEWMAVTSAAGGSAGIYTYTVTRNLDGSGANDWAAGDAALDTGTTGGGFIDLYSTAGVLSGVGPTIVGNVRTGSLYNQVAARWAVGRLDPIYGYTSTSCTGSVPCYGAAFGDASAANITIDATNGVRIRSGTTNYAVLAAGTLTLGVGGGNRLTWDGTDLTVVSSSVSIGSAGIKVAAPTTVTFDDGKSYRFDVANAQMGTYAYSTATQRTVHMLVNDTRASTGATSVQTSMEATSNASGAVATNTAAFILTANETTNGSAAETQAFQINLFTKSTGDVRIGTTGGGVKVTINGATGAYASTGTGGVTSGGGFSTSSNAGLIVASGAFGTGNVQGNIVQIGRNTSGNTAAGYLNLIDKGGTARPIWSDSTGVLRISTAPPDEDGTPSDTSGTVVGSQTSTRASKNILADFTDNTGALALLLKTPLYRFTYKSGAFNGTEFVGITTDDSPQFGMDLGRSFNPVSAFGITVGAVKALDARIRELESEVARLTARGKQ